jgi:hypothetical protein
MASFGDCFQKILFLVTKWLKFCHQKNKNKIPDPDPSFVPKKMKNKNNHTPKIWIFLRENSKK